MSYRPDIDGLRAWAVLSVMIFHAFPTALPGGFLGVDIFFVISGYLITGLILRERATGTFSFGRFYARRLRRLAPAFLVTVALTLAAGWVLFLPEAYTRAAETGLFSLVALSNLQLAGQTGYFDPNLATNPFAHTWSLAVEEQFYLVFPVLLVLATRLGRRLVLPLLALGAVASFTRALMLAGTAPDWAYYMLLPRAWELLAGGLLAWMHLAAGGAASSGTWRAGVHAGALAVLGASFLMLDGARSHPGWETLPAVLATLTLIHAGRDQADTGIVTRAALSNRVLVHLGQISYSAYLIHFPLLAFVIYRGDGYPDPVTGALVLLATLGLAHLSWRYVETPVRKGSLPTGILAVRTGAGVAVLAVAALVILDRDGMPARVPERIASAGAYAHPFTDETRACHAFPAHAGSVTETFCAYGDTDRAHQAIVWGDSHTAALASGMMALEPTPAFTMVSFSGCPPITGHVRVEGRFRDCPAAQGAALERLLSIETDGPVILHARWSMLRDGTFRQPNGAPATPDSIRRDITRTVRALTQAGRDVIVVDPVPEYPVDVPTALALRLWNGGDPGTSLVTTSRSAHLARHAWAHALFADLARDPRVTRIRVADLFCQADDGRCVADFDGQPLYFDDDHLSVQGALRVARRLHPLLAPEARAGVTP